MFGNEALLAKFGEEAYYTNHVAPSVEHFVRRRFKSIVLQYFMRRARAGELDGVLDFGSYWYDDPATRTNGKFDCVLSRAGGLDFYECKYYAHPMTLAECEAEEAQVRAIPGASVQRIGFVCTSGFDFPAKENGYDLISGDALYDL